MGSIYCWTFFCVVHEVSQKANESTYCACFSRDGLSKKPLTNLDQLLEWGIVLKPSFGTYLIRLVPFLPSAFFTN